MESKYEDFEFSFEMNYDLDKYLKEWTDLINSQKKEKLRKQRENKLNRILKDE